MIKDLGHGYKIIDNKFILCYESEVFKKFYKTIDFETFKISIREKLFYFSNSALILFQISPNPSTPYF